MKPFNREKFLLWMLTGLLTWQAAIFSYGMAMCVRSGQPREHCPELGDRFDSFVQTSLGAVLGLLAGSAVSKKDEHG